MPRLSSWRRLGAGALDPVFDLLFGLGSSHAVPLLNETHELLRLTLDDVQIVIGQLAPLLARLALELIPLSLERVFVHSVLPSVGSPLRSNASMQIRHGSIE